MDSEYFFSEGIGQGLVLACECGAFTLVINGLRF